MARRACTTPSCRPRRLETRPHRPPAGRQCQTKSQRDVNARACTGSAEFAATAAARWLGRGYAATVSPLPRGHRGENMHRSGPICAVVAFALFASPSVAQQTAPDQPLPPTQQSVPESPPTAPSRKPLRSRRHPSPRCLARLRGTALSISANIGLRMRVTGPCTGTTQPDIRRCGVTTTSPDIGITATWPRIGITRSGINTGRHIATGGTAGPSRARAPSLRRPASPSARESAAAGSTAASRLRAALHGTA